RNRAARSPLRRRIDRLGHGDDAGGQLSAGASRRSRGAGRDPPRTMMPRVGRQRSGIDAPGSARRSSGRPMRGRTTPGGRGAVSSFEEFLRPLSTAAFMDRYWTRAAMVLRRVEPAFHASLPDLDAIDVLIESLTSLDGGWFSLVKGSAGPLPQHAIMPDG